MISIANERNSLTVSLLTGGDDPSYALPLLSSLVSKGVIVEFIGNDAMRNYDVVRDKNVIYLNLRGDQNEDAPIPKKIVRLAKYYWKLVVYAAKTDSKILHILWLNKFIYFDRTILNYYYRILGKKLVFTAHNVNAEERDEKDTLINRLTLRILYNTVDHIFVHTNKMKLQLSDRFGVNEDRITVIPFGINNFVPTTEMTFLQAKKKLDLNSTKTILFFGQIAPYKGLEYLILAMRILKERSKDFKLIIAGKVKKGYEAYWKKIELMIEKSDLKEFVFCKTEFVPDDEVECYFKAADVLVLPYKKIFQTGVLFLAYNFGLPVVCTDVGSVREEVIEGETGFICKKEDPKDLAERIILYFNSDLFINLAERRIRITERARRIYSWEIIGEKTCEVYRDLIGMRVKKS